jgi:hypothetical protein
MERSTSLLSRRSVSSSVGSLKTATSNSTSHTLKSPQPAPALVLVCPITPSRRHVPNVTRRRAERNRALQELSEDQAVTELLERVLSQYPRQKCRTLDEHQQEAKKELSRQKDELCASLHSQQQQQQRQQQQQHQPIQGEEARANEQKERVTLKEQLEFTHSFSDKNRGNSQVTAVTDNRSTDDSSALLLSTEAFEELQCILEEKLAAKLAEEASTVADSDQMNDDNNINLDMKLDNKQKSKDVSLNTKNANTSSDEDEDESVVLVLAPSESPSIGQFMRKSLLRDKDPRDNKPLPSLPVMSPCFGQHIRKSLPLHENDTATPSLQHHLKRESHPSSKPKRDNGGGDSKKNPFCYPTAPPPPLPLHKEGMTSDHVLLCLDELKATPPSSKAPILSNTQLPPDKDLSDFFRGAVAGNCPPTQLPAVQQEDRTMDDFLRQAVEEQATAGEMRQEDRVSAPIAPIKKQPDHKPSLDSSLRKVEDHYVVETSSTGRRVGKYAGTVCRKSAKPHGVGTMIYPGANGSEPSWYKGNWIQGEWSGVGTHQKANGDVYQGEFLHHTKHGNGLYRYGDSKRTFEGRYARGERVEGRMTYADGSVYEGQWHRGKRHGRGSYIFCDGSMYDGQFERDQMHGTGQLTWPEPGGAFVGGWCRGQRHGRGREWDARGTLLMDGMWNDGVPVEQN